MKESEQRPIYLIIFSIVSGSIMNMPFMISNTLGVWNYFAASVLLGLVSLLLVVITPFKIGIKILYHLGMYFFGAGLFLLIRIFDDGVFGNFKIILFYTPVIILTGSLSLSYVIKFSNKK